MVSPPTRRKRQMIEGVWTGSGTGRNAAGFHLRNPVSKSKKKEVVDQTGI
jgi:hypothetical protein